MKKSNKVELPSGFLNILQSNSNQDSVVLVLEQISVRELRIQTEAHIFHGQVIFNKCAKISEWGGDFSTDGAQAVGQAGF